MNVPTDSTSADPSLKEIVRKFFGCKCYDEYAEYQLVKKPANPAHLFEFGPMLICNEQVFLLLVSPEWPVMSVALQNLRVALPQYAEYSPMPILMSTVVQPDQVGYLTKQGIYAMALGEETMELLNFDELQSR